MRFIVCEFGGLKATLDAQRVELLPGLVLFRCCQARPLALNPLPFEEWRAKHHIGFDLVVGGRLTHWHQSNTAR
jgi:hypothetical protein